MDSLIVVGSSTHPSGNGNKDFFRGMFHALHVKRTNFFTGPFGIYAALRTHRGGRITVLSTGWGAANASLLLMVLQSRNDPILERTVFILDNNVSRPAGGFGTIHRGFALIGVNPFPTPSDTKALAVVDIGYEYDYNSNAPADIFNPIAAVNSLVAYLYRHRSQNELDLPINADGSPCVTDDDSCVVTQKGNTTYITYRSNGLPLANLIRNTVPFGNAIAGLIEPVLTRIVNAAYPGGNPIPADPSRYQPATPFSSFRRNKRADISGLRLCCPPENDYDYIAEHPFVPGPVPEKCGATVAPGKICGRASRSVFHTPPPQPGLVDPRILHSAPVEH